MDWLKQYGHFVVLGVQALIAWAAWSMRNVFATKRELKETDGKAAELHSRVDGLERDIQRLPSKDDLHRLQLEIAELVGEIKLVRSDCVSLTGLVQRVESAVTRHEMIISDAARSK
ncbi:MAG: DUF2730 family protein [Rhodospirillaceae bacterium]|nr:MAG: DUF2730 family protein [Rhodospirillaceae bacterium]